MSRENLTIVTALFDIGRDKLDPSFRRSFDHYLECFGKLLRATASPMVIFCDEKIEAFVRQSGRDLEKTRFIRKTNEDLRNFPFYQQVQNIRKDEKWLGQSGWLRESTQASLELYNPLVMSKQFFLNDASLFNFFDTKYFLWVDAGISNTLDVANFGKELEARITPMMDKMLYICFPYDGQQEVHGFAKAEMNRYAGCDTKYVARGGVFGGSKDIINNINDVYYATLSDSINSGLMGTEESIFTILTYRYPDKVNIKMIESNGLVYKFFEDLYSQELPKIKNDIILYTLTYNLPKQFELWAESFIAAYPEDFQKMRKIVINNSDDPKVKADYRKLFKKYNFEEIAYDNIGICDGRHKVAEHFENSDYAYMIFFEDDMLLHAPNSDRCKNGFTTYQKNLFDSALDIIKKEKIDYLKLSFSEFYGDNHDNWAWYNLPQTKREEYFQDNIKKTRIHHTGTHRGIAYAIGEFHYCNWPLIFTRQGSKTIFLEEVYESKFEQTWMSLAMMRMREGKLKAGCLLASPINHHRQYHYKTRKENKNDTGRKSNKK